MRVMNLFYGVVIFLCSLNLSAGFDFGDLSESGSGSFNQPVAKDAVKRVPGVIPEGVKDLKIYLKSSNDVDVRLYDSDSGNPIVGWDIDSLMGNNSSRKSISYNGVNITYSGYNGDGTSAGLGNEYIEIQGITDNRFHMTAFGFAAGNALINYSWDGTGASSGLGVFTSPVVKGKEVELDGILPIGIENISVYLSANDDIDIELYDANTSDFIVGWNPSKIAKLSSSSRVIGNHNGDKIIWSGWNGRYNHTFNIPGINTGEELGKEYIRILGKSKNSYIMKVYGYQSGTARVEYQWGDNMILAASLGNKSVYNGEVVDIPYVDHGIEDVKKEYKSYSGVVTDDSGKSRYEVNRDGFSDSDLEWVASNINGLPAIAMKFSAINSGGGDVSLLESGVGSSSFMNTSLQSKLIDSPNSKIYLMGHSSGGSSIQGTTNYLGDSGRDVEQMFLIDSAGFHGNEMVTWMSDYNVPENVKEIFNFYQTDNKNMSSDSSGLKGYVTIWVKKKVLHLTTVKRITPNGVTKIHNTRIPNPTTGLEEKESSHGSIDNDSRVWKTIIKEIINNYGYKG